MEKLDVYSTKRLIETFEKSNENVLSAIIAQSSALSKIIDEAIKTIKNNGRVIYVGAGTSGRIGMIDALDVLPTFGEKKWFTYSMAGGDQAILKSLEGYEDDYELGISDAQSKKKVCTGDFVIGLSASGNTKYVAGFLKASKAVKAKTALIANKSGGRIEAVADLKMIVNVGNEIILGSTRLNAATAQKIILNMISSITAIKMNKVYDQYMIALTPINEKLVQRSIDMVSDIAMCDIEVAKQAYYEANQDIKLAIIIASKNVSFAEAKALLKEKQGSLRKVINDL